MLTPLLSKEHYIEIFILFRISKVGLDDEWKNKEYEFILFVHSNVSCSFLYVWLTVIEEHLGLVTVNYMIIRVRSCCEKQ